VKRADGKPNRQFDRFKTVDFETALRRVIERCGTDIDPDLLAGVIYTLDEKPKPQKLTREMRALGERLGALHKRAAMEGPLTTGPVTGARLEFLKALASPDTAKKIGALLALIPNLPKTANVIAALKSMRQKADQDYGVYRALYRVEQEKDAYEEGRRAGAFAYTYRYDPLHDESRSHMCLLGNFNAEWKVRGGTRRWLDGYLDGWADACRTDGAKQIPRGLDPEEPQPLPEFNAFLRKAFELRLRNTLASRAKYSRQVYERRNKLKKEIRKRYENGEIRGPSGKPIYKKDAVAGAFFDALPLHERAWWENPEDPEDVRTANAAERGLKDIRRALIGVKQPRKVLARARRKGT